MYDIIPVSNEENSLPVEQIKSFLSTADGSAFNICYHLYEIILSADADQRPHLFEVAINLFEDIDSDETIEIPISPYDSQKKELKENYGDIVNSFIEFFVNQKDPAVSFYKKLWDAIQNDTFFPSDASKVFAFYYVVIDARVPYFELGQGYRMSNEEYRQSRQKNAAQLKKIRYILNTDFSQKTEQASLLLQELGISMPVDEESVELVEDYERKLMIMVEIIVKAKKSDFPASALLKQIQDRLSE